MSASTHVRRPGFTLVELLIALVILAILAAIAIPGYRSYVQRTRRTEATTALVRIQAAQEKFFVQYNQYAPALSAAPPAGLGIPATTETGLYALALTITDGGASFRVTATANAGASQSDDSRCASFAINQNGTRSALDAAAADATRDCWR